MVTIDRLTKRAHFSPVRKEDSTEEIANVLVRDVIRLHGLPKQIVSDRDIKFTNNYWRTAMQILGIEIHMTTVNNPSSNGQVERLNRTLGEMLRTLVSARPHDWLKVLPLTEFAYNNNYQYGIESTPFYADLGYHPRWLGLLNEHVGPYDHNSEMFAADFFKDQKAIMEQVRHFMARSQDKDSVNFNRHLQDVTFQVGDKVLLHKNGYEKRTVNTKLKCLWYGPFTVEACLGNNAYRLTMPKNYVRHNVFHVKLLKPFVERATDYSKVPPPDMEEVKNKLADMRFIVKAFKENDNILCEIAWSDCDPADTVVVPFEWMNQYVDEGRRQSLVDDLNRRTRGTRGRVSL